MDRVTRERWNGGMEIGGGRGESRMAVPDETEREMKVLRDKKSDPDWRVEEINMGKMQQKGGIKRKWGERTYGTKGMERWRRERGFVFGGRVGVMADICSAHGHLKWFIYPRPPDQASDLPEFVRLEGAPCHTTQFLTFHISSHFQLSVSLYHLTRPNPVQENQLQRSGGTGPSVPLWVCEWDPSIYWRDQ